MALTKNAAYDNPAYLAVYPVLLGNATGANSTNRFSVYTSAIIKSITISPVVAGTSTNASFNLIRVTNTAASTATDTTALSTTTTLLATFTNNQQLAKNIVTGTNTAIGTLNAGDVIWVAQSTDATIQFAATAELVYIPASSGFTP